MRTTSLLILFFTFTHILLFAQPLTNQTDSQGRKQGMWIGHYPSGSKKYEGNFLDNQPIGSWIRYFENGGKKAILQYRTHSDSAMAELFDEEGHRYAKGLFVKTKKDSTWTYYNQSTVVGLQAFKNGKRDGRSVSLFNDGTPASETFYKEDQRNGVSTTFFPSGRPKSMVSFLADKRNGEIKTFYESGKVELIGSYRNDLQNGTWRYYSEDGLAFFDLRYSDGKLLNPNVLENIQKKEFAAFDKARGKLKDPQQFAGNPQELLNPGF